MQGFNLHAWISHANKHFMHSHGQTCTQVCMHVCAHIHTFRIGGEERRALHLAQSLC